MRDHTPASGKEIAVSPGDLSSAAIAGESDGALYWKITTGRRPMPTFAQMLSDQDRWNVVNYLRTLAATKPNDRKS